MSDTIVHGPKTAADVLRTTYKLTVSPAGERCAALVSEWLGGMHHFPEGTSALRKTDWSGDCVTFYAPAGLATFDFDSLTRLVFLAHDRAIRVELQPAMRRLRILLYPRSREGFVSQRHPTLEDAVALWREDHPKGTP